MLKQHHLNLNHKVYNLEFDSFLPETKFDSPFWGLTLWAREKNRRFRRKQRLLVFNRKKSFFFNFIALFICFYQKINKEKKQYSKQKQTFD